MTLLLNSLDHEICHTYGISFGHLHRHLLIKHALKSVQGTGLVLLIFRRCIPHGLHHHLDEQTLELLRRLLDSLVLTFARLPTQLAQARKVQIGLGADGITGGGHDGISD